MRKIIVSSFITLDGVIQAPGGPEEGFKYGGWSAPYYDEVVDQVSEKTRNLLRIIFWAEKHLRFLPPSFLNIQTCGPASITAQNTLCPGP